MQTVISFATSLGIICPILSRISMAALLVKVTARISEELTPCLSMFTNLDITVLVLPVPAPARIRTGPYRCSTASRWAVLSRDKLNVFLFFRLHPTESLRAINARRKNVTKMNLKLSLFNL